MASAGDAQLRRPAQTQFLPILAAATIAIWGCGDQDEPRGGDPVMAQVLQGWHVDTVGVVNITEADTINTDRGLLAVETTRVFPLEANGGEVFAWEFNALELNPVKMLILRPVRGEDSFEIIGESPMVIPRHKGANRFELPEPIPLQFPCLLSFYMPEEGTIGFRKVQDWKMLITTAPLQRPFISRVPFSMYGWRYGIRAFWRKKPESTE